MSRFSCAVVLISLLILSIVQFSSISGGVFDTRTMKQRTENKECRCSKITQAATNQCVESTLLSALQRILIEEKDNPNVDSCVVTFHVEVFLTDALLQSQLQTVLFKQYPGEMSAAVRSSGNLHNPKLRFLYAALRPAMLEIPLMKELGKVASLAGYCDDICILGGEKIQFRRKDAHGNKFFSPDYRIYGIVGFSVRKRGLQNKNSLSAKIVRIDKSGMPMDSQIRIIDPKQHSGVHSRQMSKTQQTVQHGREKSSNGDGNSKVPCR